MPSSTAVLRAVAADYQTNAARMVGPSRRPWLVEARDAALLLLVDDVGLTPTAATRRLGRKPDPVYITRARVRYGANEGFRARVAQIRGAL